MPAKLGIANTVAQRRFLAARPKQDTGHDHHHAKRRPVERKPRPTLNEWRVAKEIRVRHVRLRAETHQIGRYMKRPPDENVQDQEPDINEISDVFVRRYDMNEESQNREEHKSD